jgi:hypothetical protein
LETDDSRGNEAVSMITVSISNNNIALSFHYVCLENITDGGGGDIE